MGYRLDIPGLAERIGGGTADFIDKLGEGVREFSCELWKLFPDQIAGEDDPSSSFTRGFMNRACSDQLLPPPPEVPFEGGQCPILYAVAFRYGDVPGVPPDINSGNNVCLLNNIQGPILDISASTAGSSGTLVVVDANGMANTCNGPYDPGQDTAVLILPPIGVPDNCGDPPEKYPETTPTPADYQTVINIVSEDGDTLNYNLEYKPVEFNFPMVFDLGGIEVVLDLGGINFNFSLLDINGLPIPLPNGNQTPVPAPLDDQNRQINIRPVPPPNNEDYVEEEKTETDPKEEEIGAEIEFVRVTITSTPTNVKNQFGDGAPDVFYVGWFEFQSNGYNYPRQPIHFINNLYRKPQGATGYAYTLYEGIMGKATIYKLKQET